jgi:hypothetical protein
MSGGAFMLTSPEDDRGASDITGNLDKLRILVPAVNDSQEEHGKTRLPTGPMYSE